MQGPEEESVACTCASVDWRTLWMAHHLEDEADGAGRALDAVPLQQSAAEVGLLGAGEGGGVGGAA